MSVPLFIRSRARNLPTFNSETAVDQCHEMVLNEIINNRGSQPFRSNKTRSFNGPVAFDDSRFEPK